MAEENLYKWTDNPTVSGVAKCDTDVLNDCLMHLKYENDGGLEGRITNCLLEVPQNIKLELADGVLTLKAGSKVIVPNGAGVFDEVATSADKTRTWTYNGQGMMFYRRDTNVLYPVPLSQIHSGTTAPTGTLPSPTCWYDTTNNKVKVTSDKGATWIDTFSFPLCLLTANGTQITSIDQVFNGFGYIGSVVWCDKGVKGLIPNGRNEDGTLNNIEFTTDKILTYNSFNTNSNNIEARIASVSSGLVLIRNTPSSADFYYDFENNYYHRPDGSQKTSVAIATMQTTTNGIQTFNPKQPFMAVDYNDFQNTPHIVNTYINGTSWYRVWSDGFCEQGGVWNYTHNARFMATTITLLKALKTVLYKGATSIDHPSISTVIANCDFSTTSGSEALTHVSLSAERLYTTTTSSVGKVYWEVKGFIN